MTIHASSAHARKGVVSFFLFPEKSGKYEVGKSQLADSQTYLLCDIIKIKIHSSRDIEDFVETHHLCKLYVILRSRVLLGVCPHQRHRSAIPLGTTVSVACTRVNRAMLVSLCAEIVKAVFKGDKI